MAGAMRKDARRNRDLLIAAASELMRSEGGDIPLEAICERAGLTRGTLYRNFSHRQAVYDAVLRRDMEKLSRQIDEESDDPLAFIRLIAELTMVYDRFLGQLVGMADYDAETNQRYMADMLAPPLARAQALGLLRADLTSADVLIASRMLALHWRLDNAPDQRSAYERRLAILLRGLAADDTERGYVPIEPAGHPLVTPGGSSADR